MGLPVLSNQAIASRYSSHLEGQNTADNSRNSVTADLSRQQPSIINHVYNGTQLAITKDKLAEAAQREPQTGTQRPANGLELGIPLACNKKVEY